MPSVVLEPPVGVPRMLLRLLLFKSLGVQASSCVPLWPHAAHTKCVLDVRHSDVIRPAVSGYKGAARSVSACPRVFRSTATYGPCASRSDTEDIRVIGSRNLSAPIPGE